MDYEKKYKEALEKARQLCAYPTSKPFISDLQDIFPELKESDNKRMIQYFKDLAPFDKADELYEKYGFSHKYAIAWLEKQSESTEWKQEWSEEDENRMKKVMHILSLDGRISNAELQSIYDWLKSIRPQNTWKSSEEEIACLHDAVAKYNQEGFSAATLTSLLEQLKKLREE